MKQEFLDELGKIVDTKEIYLQEPMSRHTTFRVGGPAEVLVTPKSQAVLPLVQLCYRYQEPYQIIGNGSNLLIGDGGIDGLVIEMTPRAEEIRVNGTQITVGAGVLLPQVAKIAADQGLTGMEFAAGIPGSIGGAVVMNAGAYGGEMKDIIENTTVLDSCGVEHMLSVDELKLGYRSSCIIREGYVVTQVGLRLTPGNRETITARMKELNDMRRTKQPLEYPSAGSTFKRPEGYFAGKLIMDAGLRGLQVGGAQVSEKHCGFVVNKGNATAKDICQLMEQVITAVKRQFGVTLEPEVKMLGKFE